MSYSITPLATGQVGSLENPTTVRTVGRPRTRPDTDQINDRRANDLDRYYNEDPLIGWAKSALMNARRRARKKHVECHLTLDDVLHAAQGVTHCPISGAELLFARGHGHPRANSASIDRIDNEHQNYSPDSIAVISTRANMLKSNCTVDELINLGNYANILKNLK